MTTEINWNFIIYQAGAPVCSGALSTIDLSFPARMFDRLAAQYPHCKIKVRNSVGEIYEKEWE